MATLKVFHLILKGSLETQPLSLHFFTKSLRDLESHCDTNARIPMHPSGMGITSCVSKSSTLTVWLCTSS